MRHHLIHKEVKDLPDEARKIYRSVQSQAPHIEA